MSRGRRRGQALTRSRCVQYRKWQGFAHILSQTLSTMYAIHEIRHAHLRISHGHRTECGHYSQGTLRYHTKLTICSKVAADKKIVRTVSTSRTMGVFRVVVVILPSHLKRLSAVHETLLELYAHRVRFLINNPSTKRRKTRTVLTHLEPIALVARATSLSLSDPSKAVGSSKPSVSDYHQGPKPVRLAMKQQEMETYQDEIRVRAYLA